MDCFIERLLLLHRIFSPHYKDFGKLFEANRNPLASRSLNSASELNFELNAGHSKSIHASVRQRDNPMCFSVTEACKGGPTLEPKRVVAPRVEVPITNPVKQVVDEYAAPKASKMKSMDGSRSDQSKCESASSSGTERKKVLYTII